MSEHGVEDAQSRFGQSNDTQGKVTSDAASVGKARICSETCIFHIAPKSDAGNGVETQIMQQNTNTMRKALS